MINVTTISSPLFEGIHKLTSPGLKNYALRYGYDLHIYRFADSRRTLTCYVKLDALLDVFLKAKEGDWVFWIDNDCLIIKDQPLEELIKKIPEHKDLVIAEDIRGFVNAGVFLIRCTPESRVFLLDWLATEPDFPNDQDALNYLLATKYQDKTFVVGQNFMNTILNSSVLGLDEAVQTTGLSPFILHFAGHHSSIKEQAIYQYLYGDLNFSFVVHNGKIRKLGNSNIFLPIEDVLLSHPITLVLDSLSDDERRFDYIIQLNAYDGLSTRFLSGGQTRPVVYEKFYCNNDILQGYPHQDYLKLQKRFYETTRRIPALEVKEIRSLDFLDSLPDFKNRRLLFYMDLQFCSDFLRRQLLDRYQTLSKNNKTLLLLKGESDFQKVGDLGLHVNF